MASKLEIPMINLSDGYLMPGIGIGCWMGEPGGHEEVKRTVQLALKHEYRHIDTAAYYGNEGAVGEAIRESGVHRPSIFVTTKLPGSGHGNVMEAFNKSLTALGLDYIDLYLMHWPMANDPQTGRALKPEENPTFVETWKTMEGLLETGKVKSIGVSNFSIKNLEILFSKTNLIPSVNQIEIHPCLPNFELVEYCKQKGIAVTGYTPMGRPGAPFYTDPLFLSIAQEHNITVGQVLLAWQVQRGIAPLPKSSNEERSKQNITLTKLSDRAMSQINEFHKQPGMHRTLCFANSVKNGGVFGWTFEELGWDLDERGYGLPK
ncbi:probable GCY1-galactose-induced protein of aldo/keto reductase family [Serendipita indica DSM 11827]|uniref:Probable GCY1-galactose-induced protein of aldo/keto reductase family n=1 Tax=Serendipita indica (strain DSM 11827) TaxID=1109443 RepID=G4TEH4_SERID|nr:probable GCY1-galactose-induced protein of aldo/keto reductase family [Serendipita indica DSM 11827]